MEESNQHAPIDWRDVARKALGSAFVAGLVGGALHVLTRVVEAELAAQSLAPAAHLDEPEPVCEEPDAEDDDETVEAAKLLGVTLSASDSEIRAALRERLRSSRLHPDHGGDGEEAKRLIAAKNHLVARVRSAACVGEIVL